MPAYNPPAASILLAFALSHSPVSAGKTQETLLPGDTVAIKLIEPASAASDISGNYSISPDGKIRTPHLTRPVSANGLSYPELRRSLINAYQQEGILRGVDLNVSPATLLTLPLHSAAVSGLVERPCEVWLEKKKPLRLKEAIAICGGFTEFADPGRVQLNRKGTPRIIDTRRENPNVLDQDKIEVLPDAEKERNFLTGYRFSAGSVFLLEFGHTEGIRPASAQMGVVATGGTLKAYRVPEGVPALGCSITELETRVAEACRQPGEKNAPTVSIKLLAGHRPIPFVSISGAVQSEMNMPLRHDSVRLAEAIEFCGGFTGAANRNDIRLIRNGKAESWSLSRPDCYTPELRAGDHLIIPAK